jgi:hypothetical protein
MTHLAIWYFGNEEVVANYGLWGFLSVGAVVMFAIFIPLVTWMDTRRKEREAFYKAETFRRVAESSSEGAKAALEMMREQDRQTRMKTLEGMKIGGMITLAVGIALGIFLRAMERSEPAYLCGLIPGLIGVAMLTYALFLAPPVD